MPIRPLHRWRIPALGSALTLAGFIALGPVSADVVSSGEVGMISQSSVSVKVAPAEAYQRFLNIGAWWNPVHSYTQEANRLTLKAEQGGCFCESLKDGGFVEHMRVIFASPGKMLRLQGGLGPLAEMGASGVMTVKFEAAGPETKVTLTYAISGYLPDKGLANIAAPVDNVVHEQLDRYKKFADGGTT